ncbi:MAG: DUF2971 domain-containing protein [Deltaproteobacteria bacterium]|nr:DUF2971 domain-containing protein [Deltaproteobacteria bacterium]
MKQTANPFNQDPHDIRYYKFRSLATKEDAHRAQLILETGCFWCSRFLELNDPMEGAFSIFQNKVADTAMEVLFSQKNELKICSFSGIEGFRQPSMWGYYANGFKGIAIEIESRDEPLQEVIYAQGISELEDPTDIKKLLLRKLDSWQHEQEYRFLRKSDNNYHPIGKITAVYFGNPFHNFVNKPELENQSQHFREYKDLRRQVKQVAEGKGIDVYFVEISHGRVEKIRQPDTLL